MSHRTVCVVIQLAKNQAQSLHTLTEMEGPYRLSPPGDSSQTPPVFQNLPACPRLFILAGFCAWETPSKPSFLVQFSSWFLQEAVPDSLGS